MCSTSTKDINILSDQLLNAFFSYLAPKQLCYCERVCRRWQAISRNRWLWKQIDLSAYKMTVQQLDRFAEKHFSQDLHSLSIQGSPTAGDRARTPNRNPSVRLFSLVDASCPSLTQLRVSSANLTKVPLNCLPSSVLSLAITASFLPSKWFDPLNRSGVDGSPVILPHIRQLDLSRCTKTSDANLGQIVRAWPQLTTLKINGCCGVSPDGLRVAAEGLNRLEVLDVGRTHCDGVAIHHVCRNLSGTLREFNVAGCQSFDNGCAGTVSTMLVHLTSLDVSKCRQLTREAFPAFGKLMKSLRVLNVASTTIDAATVELLRRSLPSCEILSSA